MRALFALALAGALSGCATSWIITQSYGSAKTLDEGVREVSVPAPGVQERFAVSLPLVIEYAPPVQGSTVQGAALPFALSCRTEQRAKDVVYHSAFRYGKRWKWASGIMALVEGGLAAVMITYQGKNEVAYQLGGLVLAADALVTTGLFFIPRKEIYRHEDRTAVTPVRSDCPEGMALTIAGQRFPVDAAGKVGELGESALDAWMSAPSGPLVVEAAGQARTFEVGPGEQCVWSTAHHTEAPAGCYGGGAVALRSVMTAFDVPVGSLSGLALQ